jgi:hypothetical protein
MCFQLSISYDLIIIGAWTNIVIMYNQPFMFGLEYEFHNRTHAAMVAGCNIFLQSGVGHFWQKQEWWFHILPWYMVYHFFLSRCLKWDGRRILNYFSCRQSMLILMLEMFVTKRNFQVVPLVLLESDAGPSPKLSSYCTCLQNHKW